MKLNWCYCVANVLGNLVRLDVTDGGMGYYAPPTITITGGNGFGAMYPE